MGVRGALGLLLVSVAAAQEVSLAPAGVTPAGVRVSSVQHAERSALRLIEADNKRGGGIAVLNGQTFKDGTIEVDVAGRRGPDAVADDRGFIGIAFRVSADRRSWEEIYLRPDNGRAEDQVRRNHSIQYASIPEFPWPRMRKEFPERYESYVDLVPGEWTRMRIDVSGTSARLFVNGAAQPNLIVNDLKHGAGEGGVALWIGAGTEGFFSNLTISKR